MRRLFTMTLAVAFLGIGLIPSSADAGILQRLFGRNRNTGGYVVQPVRTEADVNRRYSYEPSDGAVITTRPSRTAARPTWNLPKSDPRRYE